MTGDLQYAFLETVHEYALEQLRERAEEPALRERHAACDTTYVEAAEPYLRSTEQPAWLVRLDEAYPNIRAALDRALGETHTTFDKSCTPG